MLRPNGHLVSALAGLPVVATAALATLLALVSPAPADDAVAIQHQAVHCIAAGKFPQLDACFEPASRVARARVYFRAEGGPDWYYVDMKPEAQCYRATLPRPKKSLKRMRYYVAVTDQDFAEARTEEYEADVVTSAKNCAIGAVAPYAATATVVVSGAATLPAGFAGAGLLAGVGATTVVAGAAIVGAGAAGAVIAGGGDAPTTTTTTRPPRPTTTTTTAPTTTTTTLGGCAADSRPPTVAFLSPRENADVAATVSIVVEASDPGPVSNGIREVTLSAEEQDGNRTAAIATLPGPGPRFEATWNVPACEGTGDRWSIYAAAVDGCDRSKRVRVNVRRRGGNCPAAAGAAARGPEPPGLVWTSELAVGGGRGQVIANGADVVFPGPGRSDVTLPAREGRNSIEAVLVEGDGPGTWRFTLASGSIRPGSLRVIAGEAVAVGPETLAFRLRGRPGERAIFAFEMTGH